MFARKTMLTVVVVVLVCWAGWASGLQIAQDAGDQVSPAMPGQPGYKEGELIVKFRKSAADSLESQLGQGKAPGQLMVSASLDELGRKYKVKKVAPVIKNFEAKRQRLENLKVKDKSKLTKQEKHVLRRLKRAPAGAKVPDLGRIYVIELEPGQSAPAAVAQYQTDPDVEYAELNYMVSVSSTEPNDPCYGVQWALASTGQAYPIPDGNTKSGTVDCDIDANEAWDIHTGSSDVVVAVVDTGVDYTHRDLQANMWTDSNGRYGYDFYWDNNDPMDDHGHGTHCAGTIAADSNNGYDIAGVSWNAKIMALKFLGPTGSGLTTDAVQAFYYAVDNGADVTSNSWGGGGYLQTLQDAIDYAYSQGVINVAAAGNNNSSFPVYPADYNHVIAVAATDSNDDRASFSNYGDWVDLAAPGVDILSLHAPGTDMYRDGKHYYPNGDPNATMYIASGTSMACPHVAGGCALMLSVNPYMTPDDVNGILTDPCYLDPISDGICRSDGRLNAQKALLGAIPFKGYVSLVHNYYNCDCNVGVSLADTDLAGGSTQDVNVSTSGGDLETVTLSETASGTGVFAGQIATGSGDPCSQDGVLQVADSETVTVTYEDANDGSGSPASPNDTAEVDCVDPNFVTDVNFTVVGPDVTVTFETNEPTGGRVLYGTDCNATSNSHISWGTSHAIKLRELSAWTDYYFEVTATDAAGNIITDDNDSNCYQFTTDGPRDIYVPSDFNTIQEAIDQSWDGGTVTVAEGNYVENINFKGRGITLRSSDPNDWDVVANTVIGDINTVPRTVEFSQREGPDSVLSGFTLKHTGLGGIAKGAIVVMGLSSSPTIRQCVIESKGEGIAVPFLFAVGCSPTIINNEIRYCETGLLITAVSGATVIENNRIHGNSKYGLLLAMGDASGFEIRNNLIYDNNKAVVFGMGTSGGEVVNSTIVDNNDGVWVYKDDYWGDSYGSVRNCIVRGNVDDLVDCNATYSCVEEPNDANGTGNITDDPCFVRIYDFIDVTDANGTTTTIIVAEANLYEVNDVIEYDNDGVARTVTDVNVATETVTFASDALDSNSLVGTRIHNWGPDTSDVDEDYHLLSDSPCIDKGDPNDDYGGQSDIDGQPRVADGDSNDTYIVDMGADEYMRVYNIDKWLGYIKINDAIDDANDGNTIVVTEGTYYEKIDFDGKAITVRSTEPSAWSVVANTIIDAGGDNAYAVTFDGGEDQNSVLKGLTVKNSNWGAIVIDGSSTVCSPTVSNCIITDNGWGVQCYYGSCVFENNKIYENPVWAMLFAYTQAPVIKNNLIYSTVYEGSGWYGTGIYFTDANAAGIVRNNTVVGNDRGIWCDGGVAPTISNCIVTYSCIEDCNEADGAGNICGDANDPNFVDEPNDDYHLSPGSPCINKGDPNGSYDGEEDIDGDERVMGEYVDMGADEADCLSADADEHGDWAAWGKPDCWCYRRQCRGDVDGLILGPFWVSLTDLGLFRAAYNKTDNQLSGNDICADLDHTKVGPYRVNSSDLSIIQTYLNQLEPSVPVCDCSPVITGPYNFWTEP
jgi:subtilisin family serine protease